MSNYVLSASNGHHQRWEPAAKCWRIVTKLNGWLASAAWCSSASSSTGHRVCLPPPLPNEFLAIHTDNRATIHRSLRLAIGGAPGEAFRNGINQDPVRNLPRPSDSRTCIGLLWTLVNLEAKVPSGASVTTPCSAFQIPVRLLRSFASAETNWGSPR